jgi:DNA-binding NtrC family response regulator
MTAQPAPTSKRSVLVVDDDIELLDALEEAFKEAADVKTVALANFDDAKRTLRNEKFDVLITDVRLGAFNGLQLAVVARDTNPGIRVIIFSGFDDPVLRQDAERLGATFLTKPVMSSRLLELIRDGVGPASG